MASSGAAAPALLEVRGIDKAFPGVLALRGVNLRVGRGEVVAVVGENGAGKSTLMAILSGALQPDAGRLTVAGEPRRFGSVAAALAAGVALIHQELNLCDNLSVGANVFLGHEPRRWRWLVDRREVAAAARAVLARVGLDVDPRRGLRDLSIGQRQLVEIAKALSVDARVIIMDEPTSSLSEVEAGRLLEVVRDLRAQGVGVIYVSHRLSEVVAVADRVVVLRDGRNAGELLGRGIARDGMVRLMVGRELARLEPRPPQPPGRVVLAVRELRTRSHPDHAVDLTVRGGEVVGMAGLVGAGRSEVLRALFGVEPPLAGRMAVLGREVELASPRQVMGHGVGLVPEDRKTQGLVLDLGVRANLVLPSLRDQAGRLGFVDGAAGRRLADAMIDRLAIKTPRRDQPVRLLSGGNQQKTVLGKWLARTPTVLLLDEPTRGIDVAAKAEIYRLVRELAASGVAVLFASSELDEVLTLADRVVVFAAGRVAGELGRDRMSEEAVMALATVGM